MAVTPTSLRAQFPAFASTTTYSDPMVSAWLAVGVNFVNADRWGDQTDFGVSLWTCHHLALEGKAYAAALAGQTPGTQIGVLSSKSGGGVSASYDISSSTEKDAGYWNQTQYGIQFYRLMMMFGAGPLQVGGEGGAGYNVGAWPGITF